MLPKATETSADLRLVVQQLVDEGIVEERLDRSIKGKPARSYILAAKHRNDHDNGNDDAVIIPPGARECIIAAVKKHPGITRSLIWRKAIPTKGWIGITVEALRAEGVIEEFLAPDKRGGLIRAYRLPGTKTP